MIIGSSPCWIWAAPLSCPDCMVRDLSVTGAALEVSNQIGIPAKFLLVIPGDGLNLPCHVVWRKQYRVGVAFD
jgi:hypothetical protein